MGWLDWLIRRRNPGLGGAPRLGREKTYSADSGYVYQYSLSSFRQHRAAGDFVNEYTFLVSTARNGPKPLPVHLRTTVLDGWERAHGRELSASERFGIAKIALKRAFDEAADPAAVRDPVIPGSAEIEEISQFLGL